MSGYDKQHPVFTEGLPLIKGNFEYEFMTIPTNIKTMNRTIKFRGKTETREWVYGWLYRHSGKTFIMCNDEEHIVDPNSVGQYIPIKNGSGDGLFEGDIVSFDANYCVRERNLNNIIGELVFETDRYVLKTKYGNYDIKEETDDFYYKSKVIGNTTDNPELIK